METAALVLLIIVSSILSIFLVVLIVALVYVIKVMKQVKRLSNKAEYVADSVEAAASTIRNNAAPIAAVKLIAKIVRKVNKRRKG